MSALDVVWIAVQVRGADKLRGNMHLSPVRHTDADCYRRSNEIRIPTVASAVADVTSLCGACARRREKEAASA